ncbi:hypothetical protein GIB67_039157 [Kingdonia uniflora]|uniref:CASP-like protein n=1 Tax=Kingdonia uniflora TaxID=39325 RepID=A0A7J7MLR1_9MAGN|nr:hypothetical protein GIB67_039157 [Kingdonia uniflora]
MEKSTKMIATFLLRLLALGATVAATVVMVTSHETTIVVNLEFEAKYSNDPTFKYFVVANAIGSLYGLCVLLMSSKSLLKRAIVTLDVTVSMLLASSFSAALAIAYLGKKGNSHAGWLPLCDQVPKFCDHVTGALIAGLAGVIIYLVLLLHTIHTVLNPLFP